MSHKIDETWDLLQGRDPETGLRVLKDAYNARKSASRTMELGVAFLWLGRYEEAWLHFNTAIQQHPQSIAAFFGMAGAAKWCLSDPKGAVEQWVKGLAAEYKDGSGLGVQMPILLYAASILRPGVYDGRRAKDILAKQSKDSRIKDWPGPIAVWLLRDINDETLARLCVAPEQARTKDRRWLVQFYEGVCWRLAGESKKFLQKMRELTDIQKEDWADQTFFLARMWS